MKMEIVRSVYATRGLGSLTSEAKPEVFLGKVIWQEVRLSQVSTVWVAIRAGQVGSWN